MMSQISDIELSFELEKSKKEIEEKINTQVNHVAYPHGTRVAAGEREFKAASKAGYQTGTTVRYGNIRMEHSDFQLSLPRYTIKPYFTKSHLSMIASGSFQFLVNKGRKFIV